MMRGALVPSWLAAMVLLAAACRPSSAPGPIGSSASRSTEAAPAPDRGAERFVLVPRAAWRYTAPSTDAPRVRAGDPPAYVPPVDPDRDPYKGDAVPMRLVAAAGELVEVESLDGFLAPFDARHCYDNVWPLKDFALRLFVARSDLAPVTVREVTTRFDDGTRITLAGGVAVIADEVRVDGLRLTMPLPDGSVGESYVPAAPRPAAEGPMVLAPDTTVTLGGRTIDSEALGLDLYFSPLRQVHVAEPHGDRRLVTLRSNCTELQALLPADRIVPGELPDYGRGIGGGCDDRFRVGPGAKVFWPDGRPAGFMYREHRFCELELDRGQLCASVTLTRDDSLRLCYRPEDVCDGAGLGAVRCPAQ